jgi:hypothetical protein
MVLDCLLLETLYGFLNGASTHKTSTAYKAILMAPPFCFDEDLATAFYENVRNGIVHDTETRNGWMIRMTPQSRIVERDGSGKCISQSNHVPHRLENSLRGLDCKAPGRRSDAKRKHATPHEGDH